MGNCTSISQTPDSSNRKPSYKTTRSSDFSNQTEESTVTKVDTVSTRAGNNSDDLTAVTADDADVREKIVNMFEVVVPSTLSSQNSDDLTYIDWNHIKVKGSAKEAILGKGSFGTVIKAYWQAGSREVEVAVKVMTRSTAQAASDEEYADVCRRAVEEATLLRSTERRIGSAERIVQALGVARGTLPASLTALFDVVEEDDAVGVVMRFEGGGSLDRLLHGAHKPASRPSSSSSSSSTSSSSPPSPSPLTMAQKLYVLRGVAHGLAELHAAGVVHADIKPENVLLSRHSPPRVRLADFGMSLHQERGSGKALAASSLSSTTHLRGTPVYCAPEMLVNPYVEFQGTVAKASRKTDMYAFGMLAWEVLAEERPFQDVRSESVLCSRVHKGVRPPLTRLPADTPGDVVCMVELCWHRDRTQRLSAVECLALLHAQLGSVGGGGASSVRADVLLGLAPSGGGGGSSSGAVVGHVARLLLGDGLQVRLQRDGGGDGAVATGGGEVVYAACIDDAFLQTPRCLEELSLVLTSKASAPPVALLLLQAEALSALNEVTAVKTALARGSCRCFDLSKCVSDSRWLLEEGPNSDLLTELGRELAPFIDFVKARKNTPLV